MIAKAESINDVEKEPSTLNAEEGKDIKVLKNFKASDSITVEIIKAIGELDIDIIYKLCSMVWTIGKWPKEWCTASQERLTHNYNSD